MIITMTPSVAAMGREKKPENSPSALIMDDMKLRSSMVPSTIPRIVGATGNPLLSMR